MAEQPRPRDLPDPEARPDNQAGASQPGVAVSSQVVAGAGTSGEVRTSHRVGDQGNVTPKADPQAVFRQEEADGYRTDQGIRGPPVEAIPERISSFHSAVTEEVVDHDAEIQRYQDKVYRLFALKERSRTGAVSAKAAPLDCRTPEADPRPRTPRQAEARAQTLEPAHQPAT